MSAEPATACEHEWRWLPQPVYTIGLLGQPSDAYNVECTRCGAHDWAHGRMPNGAAITVTPTPTTGRS